MTSRDLSDDDLAGAVETGRSDAETEIRARTVRYLPDRDAIELVTAANAGFLVPRAWIGALRDVPVADLSSLALWPDGSAIELEARDIHISVHGLMTALLPAMLPSRTLAAIFASRGGKTTSMSKRDAAQTNGRKGGRPRKLETTSAA